MWYLVAAAFNTPHLDKYLREGWEPFAANNNLIYLRKYINP